MLKKIPQYNLFREKLSLGFSKNIKVFFAALSILVFLIPILLYFLKFAMGYLFAVTFLPDYIIHLCTYVMMYIILALGLNILPGFTGLLDLGYVGFYGIGAYTAGLITLKCAALGAPWDILASYWVIIPLAAINGALAGILLGAPTLRLTGDYFAIVTFGFAELVVLIIINEMWLTRGPMGLPGIPPPSLDLAFLFPLTHYFYSEPIRYVFRGETAFFYLIFFMVLGTILVMTRLEDSRVGRAWLAIREDEVAAECSGINIIKYKVTAFAISAAFGAVAGSFFARWYSFISPVSFKFWESILILCMVVLGGMGSIPGVILGATFLISLSEILRKVLEPWPDLVQARYALFGVLLIVMMRFKPAGLIPIERVKREMGTHEKTILEAMNESLYKVTHEEEKL